ncbi:high-affinity lysophosphatidic acid receptor-like [Stegodyphus dumicola]|uniref:high-affinity lysophosphatidic acid receptor-like n=1 Tax=Stegodyphus dumicola TaxID=202533 RepID=UPI0015B34A6B|nr:high-affinity lysophosphatidic acid receptor-like [Stegodyphus dumicola]
MFMNLSVNATDDCDLFLSFGTRTTLSVVLSLVLLVGTTGNFTLSVLVTRHTEMRSLINVLLATMAVSDALVCVFCVPLDLATIILGKWVFGRIACITHAFLLSVFLVQNVIVLVIISIDRYFILVHKKDYLHKCHATAIIPMCFGFSLAVSSPPLFGIGQFSIVNEYCNLIYGGRHEFMYSAVFSSLLFVLPCGLLLLAYVHIIVIVRKTNHKVQPEFGKRLAPRCSIRQFRINMRFKQKTFSTILCLYWAAVICKLPLAISLLVHGITKSSYCRVLMWIMLLTYLNSALNPFIYAMKITKYWEFLNSKFYNAKNKVNTLKTSRRQSKRESLYRITRGTSNSVI